ncbi:MAG: phasin family protein [Alphaproteobacteria bacterium]
MTSGPLDIPQEVRDSAAESVDNAKKAFDQFLKATEKAVSTSEDATRSVSESAADMSRETLSYVEDNIAASFDLARRMVQARTVEEINALQQEYLRRQAASMAQQGQALGRAATKIAKEATESK